MRMAFDDGQDVVEVMRDAPGELTQGFQLMHLRALSGFRIILHVVALIKINFLLFESYHQPKVV